MIKAFLFDLDGVLTDTSECHYQAWKRLADEIGVPFTRIENEALRGVSRLESLKRLLRGRPVTLDQMQEMMERKNGYYVDLVSQITPQAVLPGSLRILAEIRAAGLMSAVVSSSKNADLVVDRLNLRPAIDLVVNGGMAEHSKPAPDLFLVAARLLGVQPGECVVVEDATAGVEAGIAGGMLTLGLGPVERVGIADMVAEDLSTVTLAEIQQTLEKANPKKQKKMKWTKPPPADDG